jgi:hypothetical protein
MATTVQAFKFIFEASKMQALLDTKPGKVVCVVSIEEVTTLDGKKAGALKIIARGPQSETKEGGFMIEGCPDPPCKEQ